MGDVGISDDGKNIVFSTWQSLISDDSNNTRDVYYVANPLLVINDTEGAVTEALVPAGNLSDSGSIGFEDVDLLDTHVVSAAPIGAGQGTLNVVLDTDTTGSGAGSADMDLLGSRIGIRASGRRRAGGRALHRDGR